MTKTASRRDKKESDREPAKEATNPHASRETVESIVVAVILAFLFRAFVAEAFVIPTGSMAPTLQGRHLDVKCEQCGHRYRTGASRENELGGRSSFRGYDGGEGLVTRTSCPICRFPMELDRSPPGTLFLLRSNQDSFNGDRILVSKFAYQFSEPRRWDVIVFKYPGNAKQNYIKRLIGLPGETIVIKHGDIYAAPPAERAKELHERLFDIARKPPNKVKAMLQLVDDTRHLGAMLRSAGWPSRWQSQAWQIGPDGSEFTVDAGEQQVEWLRYRHLVPQLRDWADLSRGQLPFGAASRPGQLITDYYTYNDFYPGREPSSAFGSSWVGDLAVECELEVQSDTGQLLLDLVEGGAHYTCSIALDTGRATLSIDGGRRPFIDAAGNETLQPTASTRVKRPGKYRLRLANVDDQLLLWVNERHIQFDTPTTYVAPENVVPKWSPADPGDLQPAGIGAQNASLRVTRLRVLRDVYYQAVEPQFKKSEYENSYEPPMERIQEVFTSPQRWATTDLFDRRRQAVFELDEDQFFPMGDNSPQSKDARLWSEYGTPETGYDHPPPYVQGELLIGKALLIYWPHMWRPLLPNFGRMGLIR